jgi:hypothetical protein
VATPEVDIVTDESFEPSERLRAALERVAREVRAADEPEVEGFAAVLNIGGRSSLPVPRPQGWNDGCWGFKYGPGGHCGWFQDSDEGHSCVGHWF